MPFKSQAQRRKFAQLFVQGKIDPDTFEEWNRETGGRKLPERVKKRGQRTTSRRNRKTRKTTRKATRPRARASRRSRR